jgi:hypothetical protein
MITCAGSCIGALQAVEPNDFEAFILGYRVESALATVAALTDNLDHIALLQTMFGHDIRATGGQVRDRNPRVAHWQPVSLLIFLLCHRLLPLVQAPDFQDRVASQTGQRAKKEAGGKPGL